MSRPQRIPPAVPDSSVSSRRRLRLELGDGCATTLHVVGHDLRRTRVEVVRLPRPEPLWAWSRRHGLGEALVGGFYVRGPGTPLGELRTDGRRRASVPFDAPWGAVRACLHSGPDGVRIARRDALAAEPAGDLLQAGPLLVADGEAVAGDREGFSAGAHQFDSDITAERHPRAALALTETEVLAVACEGRADDEAGLDLAELADALVALGARFALNLDGGGSTSLVSAGTLVNVPREQHGIPVAGGRAITTAVTFTAH